MAKQETVLFEGPYFVGYWHPRGMIIKPTADGLRDLQDNPDAELGECLEWWLGNGWMWINPEDIGALTDAPIMSMDATIRDDGSLELYPGGAVYAHMNYAVEDPVETWMEGKGVVWEGVWTYPVYDMYIDKDGDKIWVLDKVEFTEWNLPAHVKQMEADEVFYNWLRALPSGEGITDKKREVIYWGADVQDHLSPGEPRRSPLDRNPSTKKLKNKLLR